MEASQGGGAGERDKSSPITVVSSFWKEFDLEKEKSVLDEQGLRIAENQENSQKNRHKLAESTRDFKKASPEEKLNLFNSLLKGYQEEVDNLTKRAKFGENAFLNIYQKLYEAPDPYPALASVTEQDLKFSELEAENRKMKVELEEFRTEAAHLKNQQATIRRLEERNRQLELQIEAKVKETVEINKRNLAEENQKTLEREKRKFRWDETDEDEVKRIFKKKAGDHIRNVMNKAKRSQVKSDFITGDNWTKIKRTWETEKNKQMSEQNKRNRASSFSEGSATYAGGSINIGEHRKRMADELGIDTATFERTFQKKDKTWTGDRAKAIKEKYDELLMSTASGGGGVAASEPLVDNMALWAEASGGMKRGKIFEMGSLSRVSTTKTAATSSSNAAVSRRTRLEEQMTQEWSQLKHLLVGKDEEIRVLKQQIQLVLRHLNLDHDEVPPVPPTNPIGDGHNDERHDDDEIAADDNDDFVSPC